jgi:hypothetical protein
MSDFKPGDRIYYYYTDLDSIFHKKYGTFSRYTTDARGDRRVWAYWDSISTAQSSWPMPEEECFLDKCNEELERATRLLKKNGFDIIPQKEKVLKTYWQNVWKNSSCYYVSSTLCDTAEEAKKAMNGTKEGYIDTVKVEFYDYA